MRNTVRFPFHRLSLPAIPRIAAVSIAVPLAIASLVLAAPEAAGQWTAHGPEDGPIDAFAFDPEDDSSLYAGSGSSGVFQRVGDAWALLTGTVNPPGDTLLDLQVGLDGSLWACFFNDGNLYRSTDGGESWGAVDFPDDPHFAVEAMAIDPQTPGLVYAGGFYGLFRSTDSGDTWQRVESFPIDPQMQAAWVEHLVVDSVSTVWASVAGGEGDTVLRSDDGGTSWQPAIGGLGGGVLSLRALTAVPGTPGSLIAATANGIYATSDGGDLWTRAGDNPQGFVRRLVVDPADTDRLWAVTFGSLAVSEDLAGSWSQVAGLPEPVNALAPHPAGNGRIYAGTGRGVWVSDDDGDTWNPSNVGLLSSAANDLEARPAAPDRLLIATDEGIFRSTDAGLEWTRVHSGRFTTLAGSDADPDVVYAPGPGFLRSDDGGATWQQQTPPDQHNGPFGAWADPTDADTVFTTTSQSLAFGPDPGYFYRSDNGGQSWDELPLFLIDEWVQDVAFGAGESRVLVALSFTHAFRSDDEGATWEPAETGLGPDDRLAFVVADPAVPNRFLGSLAGGGLVESLDGAQSWHPYDPPGLPAGAFYRIAFRPDRPSTAVAASEGGFYLSDDGGGTWSRLDPGTPPGLLTGSLVPAFAGSPTRLLTATRRGVWSHRLGAPCGTGPTVLCLQDGRFEFRVTWEDFQGGAGDGMAQPLTDDSGAFWFFREENLELVVKALDGRPVNGRWWVFYGSLSNVPFTLTVRDTETEERRIYENPPRTFASRGDTTAFPIGSVSTPVSAPAPAAAGATTDAMPGLAALAPADTLPAASSEAPLCLHDGRFCVHVTWEDFQGGSGVGHPIPLTDDTGALWFFREDNVELAIKVLDGRPVNGHWWVFFGSLSNVEFTLTVTDTETERMQTYENPPRTFASRGDTTAFEEVASEEASSE